MSSAALDALLEHLQHHDNATRKRSEEQYKQASLANFGGLAGAHVQLILESSSMAKKKFVAILLRRLISTTALKSQDALEKVCSVLCNSVGTASREGLHNTLLQQVYTVAAADIQTMKQIIDTVVTIMFLLCRKGTQKNLDVAQVWPQLFQSIVSFGDAPDSAKRQAAMELWLQLCISVNARVTRSKRVLQVLFPYLARRISSDSVVGVRLGALKAASCICLGMHPVEDGTVLKQFATFFRKYAITTLAQAVRARAHDKKHDLIFVLRQTISFLIELAENRPEVFPADETAAEFAAQVLKLASMDRASGITADIRTLLVEVFITLIHRYKKCLLVGPSASHGHAVIKTAVSLFMQMLCTGGRTGDPLLDNHSKPTQVPVSEVNESEWGADDSGNEFGEESLSNIAAVAATALDRMTSAVGAQHVAPIVFSLIGAILGSASSDWRRRWAVMVAVTSVCSRQPKGLALFEKNLDKLVQFAVVCARDNHFFVQYAAVNFLFHVGRQFHAPPKGGEQSVRSVDIMSKHGASILPVLGNVVVNNGGIHPHRVRTRACKAIAAFEVSQEVFLSHRELFDKVVVAALLGTAARQSDSPMLQAAAIAAVASFARELGQLFAVYAAAAGPVCAGYLRSCSTTAGITHATANGAGTCSAILECVGMMADSLPQDQFIPTAKETVPQLFQVVAILQSPGAVASKTFDAAELQLQALRACIRVARSLQGHFSPFLATLVQLLLAKGAVNADPLPVSFEEAEAEAASQSSRRQFIQLDHAGESAGPTLHGIDTVLVEEKATACNLLYQLANDLEGVLFHPFVQPTARLMIPLLQYPYSPTIRVAAYAIAPKLLQVEMQHIAMQHKQRQSGGGTSISQALHVFQVPLAHAIEAEKDIEARAMAVEALGDLFRSCCVASHQQIIQAPWDESRLGQYIEHIAKNFRAVLVEHESLSDCFDAVEREGTDNDEAYVFELESKLQALLETTGGFCAAAGYIVNMAGRIAAKPVVQHILSPVLQPWMQKQPGAPPRKSFMMQPARGSVSPWVEQFGWAMWRGAACLLADLVEFGGGACAGAAAAFYSNALTFSQSRRSVGQAFQSNAGEQQFLQAALYGAGVVVEKGGQALPNGAALNLAETISSILVSIHGSLEELENDAPDFDADNQEGTLGDTFDNGVAALGKILSTRHMAWVAGGSRQKAEQLSRYWLRFLPLHFDPEEAVPAHAAFAKALANPTLSALIGGNNAELHPHIARVCIEIVVMCSQSSGSAAQFLQRLQSSAQANQTPPTWRAALELLQQRNGGQIRGEFADQNTIDQLILQLQRLT